MHMIYMTRPSFIGSRGAAQQRQGKNQHDRVSAWEPRFNTDSILQKWERNNKQVRAIYLITSGAIFNQIAKEKRHETFFARLLDSSLNGELGKGVDLWIRGSSPFLAHLHHYFIFVVSMRALFHTQTLQRMQASYGQLWGRQGG